MRLKHLDIPVARGIHERPPRRSPGGVGKTRLALEAAGTVEADFVDGAHVVSLAIGALEAGRFVKSSRAKTSPRTSVTERLRRSARKKKR